MQFLRKWFHPIYFALALFLGGLIGHKINMWTNFGPQDPTDLIFFTQSPGC